MPWNRTEDETVLWKNVRLWGDDGFSDPTDMIVVRGEISGIGYSLQHRGARVIDGDGALVFPGLVDLGTDVGGRQTDEGESVASALTAAAAGGFTHVVCTPNTTPPIVTEDQVRALMQEGQAITDGAKLHVAASLTKGADDGALAELAHLKDAGASAFESVFPLGNGLLLRRALAYCAMLEKPLFIRAEDEDLAADGIVHESPLSTELGLKGRPAVAEWAGVAKALLVLEAFGGRLHLQRISTEKAATMVGRAKEKGLAITASCHYLHLVLTEDAIEQYDPSTKIEPPLREERDRDGLVEALRSGVVDCIVSGHKALTREENDGPFESAQLGAAGLETALSAIYTELVMTKKLDWSVVIDAMSTNPRKVAGIEESRVEAGWKADFTVFDPSATWTVSSEGWHSKGKNTPFEGRQWTGRVLGTMRGAKFVDTTVRT